MIAPVERQLLVAAAGGQADAERLRHWAARWQKEDLGGAAHDLLPLVSRALSSTREPAILGREGMAPAQPVPTESLVAGVRRRAWAMNRVVLAAVRPLFLAGLEQPILSGADLGVLLLLGDASLRPLRRIRLIVAGSDRAAVRRRLEEAGWTPGTRHRGDAPADALAEEWSGPQWVRLELATGLGEAVMVPGASAVDRAAAEFDDLVQASRVGAVDPGEWLLALGPVHQLVTLLGEPPRRPRDSRNPLSTMADAALLLGASTHVERDALAAELLRRQLVLPARRRLTALERAVPGTVPTHLLRLLADAPTTRRDRLSVAAAVVSPSVASHLRETASDSWWSTAGRLPGALARRWGTDGVHETIGVAVRHTRSRLARGGREQG